MKFTPRELKGNVNVTHVPPIREFFVLLSGALGLVLAVYILLGFAVDLAVPRLPVGAEQALGKVFSGRFTTDRDEKASHRVQMLLDDLSARLPGDKRHYTVSVVTSDVTNAMALPGGNIIVFSKVVDDANSENELAFVLGHELGHFANRDHLRGLGRGLVLLTISAAVFGQDSSVTDFFMNSLTGVEMKFSREQESRADRFAVDLLNSKYGHVGGALDFFEKEAKKEEGGRVKYYFATHPFPEDRIADLRDYISERGYPTGKKTPIKSGDNKD